MQTERDAEHIVKLGVPAGKVTVAGNIKFDSAKLTAANQPDEALRAEIGMPAGTPVFLAAALDKTGDEDPHMLDVLVRLRARFADAALMIVPRHPERGPDIARLVASRGLVPRRRSQKESFDDPAKQVFIVDTVGELTRFYTLAKTVFVGKSLFPPGGGQNMIEPVAQGLPVVYGPYTSNFRGVADTLAEHGGARIVQSVDELVTATIELWEQSDHARAMVAQGQAFIRSQQGATRRNVETALALLSPAARPQR
jgi:3-deoxy-D-manno-octulosonic-acid transferase